MLSFLLCYFDDLIARVVKLLKNLKDSLIRTGFSMNMYLLPKIDSGC